MTTPERNGTTPSCILGHTQRAMECPSCCGSDDLAWWRWYRTRTMSKAVKARIEEYLRTVTL